MCSCEPGFTCKQCLDTPLDDRYEENDPDPPRDWLGEEER